MARAIYYAASAMHIARYPAAVGAAAAAGAIASRDGTAAAPIAIRNGVGAGAMRGGSRALVGSAAEKPPILCAMRPLTAPTLSEHDGGRGVVIDRPPTIMGPAPPLAPGPAACCSRGVAFGLPPRPDP